MNQEDLFARLRARGGELPDPCSETQVRAAEADLGLRFPPLLRSLYLELANGGFGPRCRPLRVADADAPEPDGWESVVQIHRIHTQSPPDEDLPWPAELLEICDWGCGMSAAVDLASEDLRVVRFTPSFPPEPLKPRELDELRELIAFWPPQGGITPTTQGLFLVEAPSLTTWLMLWLSSDPFLAKGPIARMSAVRQGLCGPLR